MTFLQCVTACLGDRELVEQFDRLKGTKLSDVGKWHPIETLIDEATGRDADAMSQFVEFVHDVVWCRLDLAKELA